MQRIGFTFPLTVLLPFALGAAMVWLFLSTYNWLGFSHCQPWMSVQPPPASPVRFVDSFGDHIFLQTTGDKTYCYVQDQWKNCVTSPFSPQLDAAPAWLMTRFIRFPGVDEPFQLVRVNHFLDSTYYALLMSGSILSCSAPFETYVASLYRSGALVLLLIPLGVGIWCAIMFWKLFIQQAQPVVWDWFGHGTRIK